MFGHLDFLSAVMYAVLRRGAFVYHCVLVIIPVKPNSYTNNLIRILASQVRVLVQESKQARMCTLRSGAVWIHNFSPFQLFLTFLNVYNVDG